MRSRREKGEAMKHRMRGWIAAGILATVGAAHAVLGGVSNVMYKTYTLLLRKVPATGGGAS
jgi:hypothetical protein